MKAMDINLQRVSLGALVVALGMSVVGGGHASCDPTLGFYVATRSGPFPFNYKHER